MVAGVLDHYLFNPAFPHAATFLWLVVALGVTAAMEAERTRTGNEAIRPPLTRRTT